MTAITISGLTKSFDKGKTTALDNLTLEIPANKIIGLVGPDGAGKTTLMRCLAGLLLPTSGTCKIMGLDTVTQTEQIHKIIGYMPQQFGLYEDLTVIENLNLYSELHGVKEKGQIFDRLLQFAGLGPFQDRLAGALSGGMKQKLGLICTLFRKPKVLLLDEPTVGVDPLSRRDLWKMIEDLRQGDSTVLWSTSYLDEAEKCDHVLLFNNGKLLYQGPPADFTKRVQGRTFQIQNISDRKREVLTKAIKDKNVLDATIQGDFVRIVFKTDHHSLNLIDIGAGENAKLIEVHPKFEDAFIDALHSLEPYTPITLMPRPQNIYFDTYVIEAKNLTKVYGKFKAVDNVSFSVKRGEIFGLLGPNGAGKSTTFKMLCGLTATTEGSATVVGISLQKSPSTARGLIGYMAQKFSLYRDLTVLQNLNFFSGIYPVPKDMQKTVIDEMLTTFNMHSLQSSQAGELPLGYKQRLALACAIMHQPPILFLDEPTSGVDPITRREFWAQMNALTENGVTILVSTHFMDEAEFCDRIAFIHKGKLKVIDTPDGIKSRVPTKNGEAASLNDAFLYLCEAEDAHV
jgi:ABC-2 type transport system ATP-binding protein